MSDVSYSGPLNQWLAQAPPQPPLRVMGKSLAELLGPYLQGEPQYQSRGQIVANAVTPEWMKGTQASPMPPPGTLEGKIGPPSGPPSLANVSPEAAADVLSWALPVGKVAKAAGVAAAALKPMAKAGEGATGGLSDFITAYHGSPHDFDRFDLSKIGTGEGAQAYGHGLYFAENEGVAKGYRDTLSAGGYSSRRAS